MTKVPLEQVKECAAIGMSQAEAARHLGVQRETIASRARQHGIAFRKVYRGGPTALRAPLKDVPQAIHNHDDWQEDVLWGFRNGMTDRQVAIEMGGTVQQVKIEREIRTKEGAI